MERIQINGEWYVKESTITTQPIEDDIEIEVTEYGEKYFKENFKDENNG
jgi:hypothetical protein